MLPPMQSLFFPPKTSDWQISSICDPGCNSSVNVGISFVKLPINWPSSQTFPEATFWLKNKLLIPLEFEEVMVSLEAFGLLMAELEFLNCVEPQPASMMLRAINPKTE